MYNLCLEEIRLPLEIRPAKGGNSTLYLRIPKDVIKMYGIHKETNFVFEILDNNGALKLMYKLRASVDDKNEDYGDKL